MIDASHEDQVLSTFVLFIQAGMVATDHVETKFRENEGLSLIKFMLLKTLFAMVTS